MMPIVQVQPLLQWLYTADAMEVMSVLAEMTVAEKQEWHRTFVETRQQAVSPER